MKYSVAVLATAVSLVTAIDPAEFFPACSLGPISAAVLSATNCALTDYACQCTQQNQANIQAAAASDVITACGLEVTINEVLPAVPKFCAAANGGQS